MRLKRFLISVCCCALLTGCTGSATKPQIPGRLYFRSPGKLTWLRSGKEESLSLPAGFQPVALSPDGDTLAGTAEGAVTLIGLTGRKQVLGEAGPGAPGIFWAPSSGRLAVARGDGRLDVYEIASGRVQRISVPSGAIRELAWSPDEGRLLVGTGPDEVTGRQLHLLDLGTGRAEAVATSAFEPLWAPDGQSFLFIVEDGPASSDRVVERTLIGEQRVVLSEESLRREVNTVDGLFEQNRMRIYWMGRSPRGNQIGLNFKAAGGDPRFVTITMGPDGSGPKARVFPVYPQGQHEFPPLPCNVGPLHWVRDGREILARLGGPGCEERAAILDAQTMQLRTELNVGKGANLIVSPDGEFMGIWREAGALELLPLGQPEQRVRVQINGEPVSWLR